MAVYSVDELRIIVSDIAKQYGVRKVAFPTFSPRPSFAMQNPPFPQGEVFI